MRLTFCNLTTIAATALIFSGSAHATDNTAVLTTNGTAYPWTSIGGGSNGGTIAWLFTVGSGVVLTVDYLGFYDPADVALGDAHPVALWDTNQNLLAQVTIPSGVGANYLSGYAYQHLSSSVTLNAGNTYVLGAFFPAASSDKLLVQATNQQFDSNITWVQPAQTVFNPQQTNIAYPSNLLSPNGIYQEAFFGPTFRFTAASVPEPSTYTFFGLGALALIVAGRRKFGTSRR